MPVTRQELEDYLREHGGWYLDLIPRRGRGKLYAYAKRREGNKVLTKYLCPEDKIGELDEHTVERKLV